MLAAPPLAMQIDAHHGLTYVVARIAGFEHEQAKIVAYCAQYVDDATNSGLVCFDNGAMYERTSSAHKALDYSNFEELANHRVWIPFHFLPGNGGLEAGEDPDGGFIDKLVCRPDSPVARDVLRAAILERDHEHALYRWGITMHVYADTWAHQGFVGVRHAVNEVEDLTSDEPDSDWGKFKTRLASYFVHKALPLGHGPALSCPDRPYLRWSYTNCRGRRVERDNPADFLVAAERMCQAMRRHRLGDPDAEVPGLDAADRAVIVELFSMREREGELRHARWLRKIRAGAFSFGPASLHYVAKGRGSWKFEALGTEASVDDEGDRFPYRPSFLASDWKMFHDALQRHRFVVVHDVLPRYGICVA